MSDVSVQISQSNVLANIQSASVLADVTAPNVVCDIETANVSCNVSTANIAINIGCGVVAGSGGGTVSATVTAGEDLAARDLVCLAADGLAYKADATDVTKEAVGFVQAAIITGDTGTCYFSGIITGMVGLTPGVHYFLSEIPGEITAVMPSTGGSIVQQVGTAPTDTKLVFSPRVAILIAGGAAPAEGDYRITEAGDSRVTETGDFRILEAAETFNRLTETGDTRITEAGDVRVTE